MIPPPMVNTHSGKGCRTDSLHTIVSLPAVPNDEVKCAAFLEHDSTGLL